MTKYILSQVRDGFRPLYALIAEEEFFCQGRLIKEGDVGGLVSGPDILSQDGTCWIAYGALALDNARVFDDAYVGAGTMLEHNARVGGKAVVVGAHIFYDDEGDCDYAKHPGPSISGSCEIIGSDIEIHCRTIIRGAAKIGGHDVKIGGESIVDDICKVMGARINLQSLRMSKAASVVGNDIKVTAHASSPCEMTDNACINGEDITIEAVDFKMRDNARIGSWNSIIDASGEIVGNSKL